MTNSLQKQIEHQRFLNAIDYVKQAAGGLKNFMSSELAYLNQLVTGHNTDPWRSVPAAVTIRSGQTHHFSVISNPVLTARDTISHSQKLAASGDLKEAAFHLYSQLVLQHLFNDANRRTAALATLWLVQAEGGTLDPIELERFPVGDLRDPVDLGKLIQKFQSLIS